MPTNLRLLILSPSFKVSKKILEAKGPSDPITKETIQKVKQDVDEEITSAVITMGLEDQVESVKLELSKSSSNRTPNQPLSRNLKEKVDKIMQEFKNRMSRPGAFLALKQKLHKLDTVNRLIEMKLRQEKVKAYINQKLSNDIKAKIANLKDAQEKLSNGKLLDEELIEQAKKAKKELEEVLRSANLEVVGVMKRKMVGLPQDIKQKIAYVNNQIIEEIDRVVKAEGLQDKIKELEDQITKGLSSEDAEKRKADIKERILAALDATTLKEKVDSLRVELESLSGADGESKVGAENSRW